MGLLKEHSSVLLEDSLVRIDKYTFDYDFYFIYNKWHNFI